MTALSSNDEVQTLKDALQDSMRQNQSLTKQIEQYKEAYERIQQQLSDLLRHRFGSKSERFVDPTHPQLDFFSNEKSAENVDLADDEKTTEVKSFRRKKKKDTSNIPREIKIIRVPKDKKICHCGCEKSVIRYETKELFDYQPAVFCIVEQRREVVACPKGCENEMITAPAPLHVLPKVKATEELLSRVVVDKLHHRQPLYHLEKYGNIAGISRETMARWMISLKTPLQPLFNLMKDKIIGYDVASIDATTLQVLKEPGRSPQVKSYIYCIRGGPPKESVVLYDYNHSDHKIFVDQCMEGFKGNVHMDADMFFDLFIEDPEVHPSFCGAHARRKFEAIKKQAKKQGLAHEALRFYKKLYKIERNAKDNNLGANERYALRQKESKPVLVEFKSWLDENVHRVLPKSPLGKAFNYAINHWEGLIHFINDGRLEIDNNLTEQEIKPIVIARKNFMFADSMDGAHALCVHFSLIRTALLHKLDPYQYYVFVLKALPHCQSAHDYEKLLPWNVSLDQKS